METLEQQLEASLEWAAQRRNGMKTNGVAQAGAETPARVEAESNQPRLQQQTNSTTELDRFLPLLNIEQAVARREMIVQATARLMSDGVDFGKIPGTERPTLLQPGADKLCNLFGLVISYEITQAEEDWTGARHGGEPFFYYKVTSRAYRGDYLMGEGVGSCNSWESKYRWRKAERVCPKCGKENIRKSKQDSGWYCWTKLGGCGATFAGGDRSIEGQEVGRKPNGDVADVVNTVLKMAYKRAKVSCTINATSASEFFTQDVEDAGSIDIGPNQMGTQAAADFVAQSKIAAHKLAPASATTITPRVWSNPGEERNAFWAFRHSLTTPKLEAAFAELGIRDMKHLFEQSGQRRQEIFAYLESLVKQGVA